MSGSNLKLHSAGSNTLTFTGCSTSVNGSVTITAAAAANIYLNSTNTEPASSLTTHSTTAGTAASYYPYGFDTYGNSRGIETAATWGISNNGNGLNSPTNYTFTTSGGVATFTPSTATTSLANFTVTASLTGVSNQSISISVGPAATNSLVVNAITSTVTAGNAITATIHAKDQYNNLTASGCTTLSVSGGTSSPGGHGGAITPPAYPTPLSQSSTGVYTIASGDNLKLYSSGSNTLTFSACGKTVNSTITVNSAPAANIYLNNTNSAPASSLATDTGTAGTAKSLYIFGWDAYGNSRGVEASGSWTMSPPGGITAGTDFDFSHASGVASFTPRKLTDNSQVFTATASLAGTTDKTIAITVSPSALSKIVIVTHNAGSGLTAGTNNMQVTRIDGYYTAGGIDYVKPDLDTAQTINITGDNQSNGTTSCTFSNGLCTDTLNFTLTAAGSTRSLTLGITGATASTVSNITVNPATAQTLSVSTITSSPVAGTAITATIHAKDAFNNLTSSGCGTLTVDQDASNSPGNHGATSTPPSYPSPISQSSTGVYSIVSGSNLKLYAAGNNNLTFRAATCNLTANSTVTVGVGSIEFININDTNSEPTNNLASTECTAGSTVTCNLYAWAYDLYGNKIGGDTWSCPSWQYNYNSGLTGGTLGASGHSTSLTNSTWHVSGNVTCTASSKSASTNVHGKIHKSAGFSCTNWVAGSPSTSTCTLSNNTGYTIDTASYSASGSGSFATANDSVALTTSNSRDNTFSGVQGNPAGTLTVTMTPQAGNSTNVLFNDATTTIEGNANAP